MTDTKRTVLVTGATGQQGGAVARALIARGHSVRALTRDATSRSAENLKSLGAVIVEGSFGNKQSLVAAATGVDTIFLVTTPFEEGTDAETSQGLMMTDVARETGVGHLVFSSVGSADKQTGIPHFDSKYEVEKAIVASGVPNTIIAPVFFMENLTSPWILPGIIEGKFSQAMPGDRKLQYVALDTIGEVAANIIEQRDAVFGKRFDLASDELSGEQVARILTDSLERSIQYEGFPPAYMRETNEDFALMYEWFDTTGYSVDINGLRSQFSDVYFPTLEEWTGAQDWVTAGALRSPVEA